MLSSFYVSFESTMVTLPWISLLLRLEVRLGEEPPGETSSYSGHFLSGPEPKTRDLLSYNPSARHKPSSLTTSDLSRSSHLHPGPLEVYSEPKRRVSSTRRDSGGHSVSPHVVGWGSEPTTPLSVSLHPIPFVHNSRISVLIKVSGTGSHM